MIYKGFFCGENLLQIAGKYFSQRKLFKLLEKTFFFEETFANCLKVDFHGENFCTLLYLLEQFALLIIRGAIFGAQKFK